MLFLRRPGGQSQFSPFVDNQAAPGPIRDVQAWAVEHLADDLSVEKLADRAAMSPRNFARVFSHQAGLTPAKFVEQVRVEAARLLLETSRDTLRRRRVGMRPGQRAHLEARLRAAFRRQSIRVPRPFWHDLIGNCPFRHTR